jgi:hypothetical protein
LFLLCKPLVLFVAVAAVCLFFSIFSAGVGIQASKGAKF